MLFLQLFYLLRDDLERFRWLVNRLLDNASLSEPAVVIFYLDYISIVTLWADLGAELNLVVFDIVLVVLGDGFDFDWYEMAALISSTIWLRSSLSTVAFPSNIGWISLTRLLLSWRS